LGLERSSRRSPKEDAEAEKRDPELRKDNAAKRRVSRGALPAHLPRIEVTLARGHRVPVLPGNDDGDRGRHLGAAGCDPGAVSGDRDQASEARLPGLRRHRGADARRRRG
jgi:hypothetical protein